MSKEWVSKFRFEVDDSAVRKAQERIRKDVPKATNEALKDTQAETAKTEKSTGKLSARSRTRTREESGRWACSPTS